MLPVALARGPSRMAYRWAFSPRASFAQQRARTELLARGLGTPRGLEVERVTLGGVPCERLAPAGARAGAGTLLYLHGGGHVVGSAAGYRGLAGRLALAAGLPAVVPDYRLAPEHPAPAAPDDVRAVYEALLAEPGGPVVVAGDSAGGNLTLSLALGLRDDGRPLPAGLGLICPTVDLRPDVAGTRAPSPRELCLTPGLVRAWVLAYLSGGARAEDPRISPLLADLAGLPPIVLHSCGDDILAGDAVAFAGAARAAGVAVEHRRLEGLWHDVHVSAHLLHGIGDPVRDLGRSLNSPLPAAARAR